MTHEELEQIYGLLDDRYVKKDVCVKNIDAEDAKIEKVKTSIAAIQVDIAKLSTKMGIVIGILGAIAVPVISLCVKLLFGG